MKKILVLAVIAFSIMQPAQAWNFASFSESIQQASEVRAVKKVLKSQVKYANKNDFKKFISTYDAKYVNSDGFDLDIYSSLVKDIWNLYDGIEYAVKIKDVTIDGEDAVVKLIETSFANFEVNATYDGELKSEADSIYYLKKRNGRWKVISDEVVDETTSMLYGSAKDLDIKLTVPTEIAPGVDYTAVLEFEPPKETFAIASIASDKVEYPQKPTKEVFRLLPEDNILERIFTSNTEDMNEYVVASIGLTQTTINDTSLNLNLTGFGYTIRRVNVISKNEKLNQMKGEDVKAK